MSKSRNAQIAALLHKAKSALEEHGWQQGGDFADEAGRLSLDGALNAAVHGQADRPSEGSAFTEGVVRDVLALRGHDDTVADWNDEPGRSVAEVYALLDEAIGHVAALIGA